MGRCVSVCSPEEDQLPAVGASGFTLVRMELEGRQHGMRVFRVGTSSNSAWALPLTSISVRVKLLSFSESHSPNL